MQVDHNATSCEVSQGTWLRPSWWRMPLRTLLPGLCEEVKITDALATEKANGRAKAPRKKRCPRTTPSRRRTTASAPTTPGTTTPIVKSSVVPNTCRKAGEAISVKWLNPTKRLGRPTMSLPCMDRYTVRPRGEARKSVKTSTEGARKAQGRVASRRRSPRRGRLGVAGPVPVTVSVVTCTPSFVGGVVGEGMPRSLHGAGDLHVA